MNTLSITVATKGTEAIETAVVINGARVGTVVLARWVESTCRGVSAAPVFEAFGLDDISRGEFSSRTGAALSLMAA